MTPNTVDLAEDLIRIHKVITRALDVILANGKIFLQGDGPQTDLLTGYVRYTHSLATVLRSHHESEDLISFPEIRKYIPAAPYVRLAAEHVEVEKLLEIIFPAISSLGEGSQSKGLKVIVETVEQVSKLWQPHYQREERYFSSEALRKVLDLAEQGRISGEVSKYSQQHSEPPAWVVPFVVFNLSPADRAGMIATLPPMVMDELIPKVWKEQWSPMKPFLLD